MPKQDKAPQDKITFSKISLPEDVKREIDIIAAHERRPVYQVVGDAWELYKTVAVGKGPIVKKTKKPVSVVDVIENH